jgi:LysM domain
MEAGMSALSAIEAAIVDQPAPAARQATDPEPDRRVLRLVPQPDARSLDRPVTPGDERAQPRSSSIRPPVRAPLTDFILTPSAVLPPRSRPVALPPPLRLTRRGRAVVAALVVALVAGLALAIAMATAGGARAASHGQPGGSHQGMHEIVVQPGQTLWSIASAAEPTADPRLIVPQIMAANGLTSTNVAAGQLLWVPR